MSTIGWLLILMSAIIVRQVVKGRVMETTQDLSDAFLAIVSGDTKGFNAVLARTGEYATPDRADLSDLGEGTITGHIAGGDLSLERYKLSPKTKPKTVNAINKLGAKHGIKTASGWRAVGSVPNSSHPKGLAGDLMTNNIPNGKAVGDRLAADAVASASSFGITEVIWYKRIWSKEKGWRDYNGPSDHTDHVHITLSE
jgi:hypothetical protein